MSAMKQLLHDSAVELCTLRHLPLTDENYDRAVDELLADAQSEGQPA